jgi:hypothetical protein
MQSKSNRRRLEMCLCVGIAAYLLAGCAGRSLGQEPKEEMVGAPIGAVGHYGADIGIPEFYVDGRWGGNNVGWGGGGAGVCCVLLPAKVTRPVMVNVKWETCDTSGIEYVNGTRVDPDAKCKSENHEAKVPVHFEIDPGEGGFALFIHFLPAGRLEAWYTKAGPQSTLYPGPKFPRGKAPSSVPFASQKASSAVSNLQEKPALGVEP